MVLNQRARLPWGAYVNFEGGASLNVFYNTFFIDFELKVFSPIVWLSVLKYCLRYYSIVSNCSLQLYGNPVS